MNSNSGPSGHHLGGVLCPPTPFQVVPHFKFMAIYKKTYEHQTKNGNKTKNKKTAFPFRVWLKRPRGIVDPGLLDAGELHAELLRLDASRLTGHPTGFPAPKLGLQPTAAFSCLCFCFLFFLIGLQPTAFFKIVSFRGPKPG